MSAPIRDLVLPGVERIAVLRANRIGDFIATLPALDALAVTYPQAELVLLGDPWHAEFLAGRPGPVERVVVIPPIPGIREGARVAPSDAELAAFWTRMERESFDIAVQLHGGGTYSNEFVRRLGARLTAGLRAEDAPPLDRWIRYVPSQPEVLRQLEAVALVGAVPCTLEPSISVTAADEAEVTSVLEDLAGMPIIVSPGARDPRRRWPPRRFAAVADALAAMGHEVVIIGDADDQDRVAGIIGRMEHPARSLVGCTSLGGLAALLEHAALVIGNDSGPLHLAAAVGTPTVGLFWCGNVHNWAPLFVHQHRQAISWTLHCPRCGTLSVHERCKHNCSFLTEITVQEVTHLALDLLAVNDEPTTRAPARG